MTDFQGINRVMGTRREQMLQEKNGDFRDQLGTLLDSVDPFWEDREETEMDIFYRQGPLQVVVTEDGEVETEPTQTARTPTEEEYADGEEPHRVHAEVLVSRLVPRGQMEAELEEIEA